MALILITGGSGFLGRAVARNLPDAAALSSTDLDLTDGGRVMDLIGQRRPKVVVHLDVDRIWIDTDSDEVAAAVGAAVVRSKPELVGDKVSVNLIIKDFLESHDCEHLLQTHATNPLLKAATVDAAVARYFEDPEAISLFGVTRIQARLYRADLSPVSHDPAELIPTRDLDPVYLENSKMYIFSRAGFFERDTRITARPILFEMDPVEAVDIDEERDFRMAELLYEGWHRR